MKRILLALTMVGCLLPLAPRAQAETEVSLNFFYDNLSTEGNWIEVADYGYCFQPAVAVTNADWRPYSDGYWAYTDAGWTWVSYEDFGWATYHYGRWSRLVDYGWVWVPGYEWAPAWVSWRTGGDYVGWAPLPPDAEPVYEGRAITGQVDLQFDIGPEYYNFIDVRFIGEPVLRGRIFEPGRNVTIINRTVNVTNITYNNSTVYNYGPSYERLNQFSNRPIQRLALQRETTVGANFGAQAGGRRNFNRVNGNQLMVVAPPIRKSPQPIAPRQVKARVDKPQIEHGWRGISNRQQLQAEMKAENPKKVPPPTFQPVKGRKPGTAAGAQNAAPQPNEAIRSGVGRPGNVKAGQISPDEKNQPAVRALRPGQRNAARQNAGPQTGRLQKAQEKAQNKNPPPRVPGVEADALQERVQPRPNVGKPNQPRAIRPARATPAATPQQALQPQRVRPAQGAERPQPANRPQQAIRPQPVQQQPGAQNPNAPRKPKKKNPDEKPEQPQP